MPGSMNSKNLALSPAATDLGLGDALKSQVESAVLAEKKRKKQQSAIGDFNSTAAQMLLNPTFGGGNG